MGLLPAPQGMMPCCHNRVAFGSRAQAFSVLAVTLRRRYAQRGQAKLSLEPFEGEGREWRDLSTVPPTTLAGTLEHRPRAPDRGGHTTLYYSPYSNPVPTGRLHLPAPQSSEIHHPSTVLILAAESQSSQLQGTLSRCPNQVQITCLIPLCSLRYGSVLDPAAWVTHEPTRVCDFSAEETVHLAVRSCIRLKRRFVRSIYLDRLYSATPSRRKDRIVKLEGSRGLLASVVGNQVKAAFESWGSPLLNPSACVGRGMQETGNTTLSKTACVW